jgi:hypothetical protein
VPLRRVLDLEPAAVAIHPSGMLAPAHLRNSIQTESAFPFWSVPPHLPIFAVINIHAGSDAMKPLTLRKLSQDKWSILAGNDTPADYS